MMSGDDTTTSLGSLVNKPSPKVLYVDDEQEFVDLAVRMLGAGGAISVDGATSGEAAFKKLYKEDYDVIISDYQMPEMNGIDLLRKLRAAGIDTPFVIVTGKGREDVAVDALNSGADLYIPKSLNLKALFAEISTMIKSLAVKKRAGRSLLKERDFFGRIIDMNAMGISAFDVANRVVIWNPGMEMFSGVMKESILGQPLSKELSPILSAIIDEDHIANALKGVTSMLNERLYVESETREERYFDVSYFPVTNDDGESIGGLIIVAESTERKRMQNSIIDSERGFRFLLENAGDGIAVHDLNGVVIDVNNVMCDRLGYSKKELIGLPLSDFIVAEDRKDLANALKKAAVSNSLIFESVFASSDGKGLPVEINMRHMDYLGQPAILSIFRDARRRKLAEKELIQSLESREEFERIVNASPVVVLLMRPDPLWSVRFVSKNITQFGYTPDEFESGKRSFTEIIHPDDLGTFKEEAVKRVEAGDHYIKAECRILTKAGEVRWIDSRVLVRRDSEGNVTDFQGIVLDVTERSKFQEETERLALIVDSSLDAIIGKGLDGTILSWNKSAEVLYGYSAEEAIGKPVTIIVPTEQYPEYRRAFRQVKRGKRVPWFETVRVRKDGTKIDVSLTISPVKDRTGKIIGASAITKDITGRKRTEKALRQANEKLSLLGSITRHDVINQVAVLMGYLSLLEGNDDGPRSGQIAAAKQACMTITEQLQFAGSYQKAGMKPPEWVRVRLELLGAVSMLDMGDIEVSESLGDVEILVDPLFEKVFLNLLMNSRKHGQRVTKITASYSKKDDGLILVYSDDGVGIPDEEKDKIFDRGYGKDSGLGLFLIREVLAMTGINISEVGTLGKGATFQMDVPRGKFRFAAGSETD
ncbi:MAG: PAS domain S-box protein [Thermoplasmata archaeon]|nr:PAS domain S-box protein [Thermoplasmata archaeon]